MKVRLLLLIIIFIFIILGPRGPHGIPLLVRPQEKFGSLIYRPHESSWIPPLTPWDPLIPPINPHDP